MVFNKNAFIDTDPIRSWKGCAAQDSKIPQWLEDPELSRSLSPHGKSSLIILKSNSKDVPRSFYDRMNVNDS